MLPKKRKNFILNVQISPLPHPIGGNGT